MFVQSWLRDTHHMADLIHSVVFLIVQPNRQYSFIRSQEFRSSPLSWDAGITMDY